MKVVILCGGLGSRLREETEFRPKPMLEIGGKPILNHIMNLFAHYDYKDFILCLGYKGEIIKEYFYNYELINNDFSIELGSKKRIQIHSKHRQAGWRVTLVDTGKGALKGARLYRVKKYISDDVFLMTYGDGVADVNIPELLAFHRSHGKVATLTGINPASRFGELKTKNQEVLSFSEKPKEGNGLINGGFFVFSREIFNFLKDEDSCDLEIGALEEVAKQRQLMAYIHKGFWSCMDTLRDMEYLNRLWNQGEARWKIWE